MRGRLLSVLATGVTGALVVGSLAWAFVGLTLVVVGELSWLSFFTVALVCSVASSASLRLSERALRRALANDDKRRR